jgi:hypothetical protein
MSTCSLSLSIDEKQRSFVTRSPTDDSLDRSHKENIFNEIQRRRDTQMKRKTSKQTHDHTVFEREILVSRAQTVHEQQTNKFVTDLKEKSTFDQNVRQTNH